MEIGKDFEIIADQEKKIEADLTAKNLDFSSDTAKILIRHLAAAQVMNWFEMNYNILFGSQIALLRKLQDAKEGLKVEDIDNHFDDVRMENPEIFKTWNSKQYLTYLRDSGFVIFSDDRLTITKIGLEFLKMLSNSNNHPEMKAL